MQYNTHSLANGATIVTFSPHSFKFSDGTVAPPQNKDFCDLFTLQKKFEVLREIKGMKVTSTKFILSDDQLSTIHNISKICDLLLVPFQMLEALKGCVDPSLGAKLVAFNSTPETARSAPQDKVVDINNWSGI